MSASVNAVNLARTGGLGQIHAVVGADISGLKTGLVKAEAMSKASAGKMSGIFAGGAAKIGLGFAAIGAAAAKMAMDFETSMARVATLIPNNAARIKELSSDMLDLSTVTGKTANDLAGGLYQVVSAFQDSADSAKIMEIAAKGATAGMATTTDAVNLLSAVTKGYGDTSAEAVQKASDLAFLTVKLGQTTFPELAASIGRTVPLAAKLGVSVEELHAGFATLTGVTGNAAEVSTQLAAIMRGFIKPTNGMTNAISQLGYSSAEAMLNELGLVEAMKKLIGTTDGTTEAVGKLFRRAESMTAVFSLTGAQADTFNEKLEAMGGAAGSTDEAFKEMEKTTGHKVQVAINKFTSAMVELGTALLPVVDGLADFVGLASNLVKPLAIATDWAVKGAQALGGYNEELLQAAYNAHQARIKFGEYWQGLEEISRASKESTELTKKMNDQFTVTAGTVEELDDIIITVNDDLSMSGKRAVEVERSFTSLNDEFWKMYEAGQRIDNAINPALEDMSKDVLDITGKVEDLDYAFDGMATSLGRRAIDMSLVMMRTLRGIAPETVSAGEAAADAFASGFQSNWRSLGDFWTAIGVGLGDSITAGLQKALDNYFGGSFDKYITGKLGSVFGSIASAGIPVLGSALGGAVSGLFGGLFGGDSEQRKKEEAAQRAHDEQIRTNQLMAEFSTLIDRVISRGKKLGDNLGQVFGQLVTRGASVEGVFQRVTAGIKEQRQAIDDTKNAIAALPGAIRSTEVAIDNLRRGMHPFKKAVKDAMSNFIQAVAASDPNGFDSRIGDWEQGSGRPTRFGQASSGQEYLSAIAGAQGKKSQAGMRITRKEQRGILAGIEDEGLRAALKQLIIAENAAADQKMQLQAQVDSLAAQEKQLDTLKNNLPTMRERLKELKGLKDNFKEIQNQGATLTNISKGIRQTNTLLGGIPRFADGGVMVDGGLAMLHPNELVVNQDQFKKMTGNMQAVGAAKAGGGSAPVHVHNDVYLDGQKIGGFINKSVEESISSGRSRIQNTREVISY